MSGGSLRGPEGDRLRTRRRLGANASAGRYQGLEQRLQAELQAAATSKEEALRGLKDRALQLEEELFQVRPCSGALGVGARVYWGTGQPYTGRPCPGPHRVPGEEARKQALLIWFPKAHEKRRGLVGEFEEWVLVGSMEDWKPRS